MAKYHGKNATLKLDTSGEGSPAAVINTQSWSLDHDARLSESTSIDDAAVSRSVGIPDWSLNVAFLWDGDDAAQADLIVGASIDFECYPEDEGTGNNMITGTGIVASRQIGEATPEGDVPGSCVIQANGSDLVFTTDA